MGILLPVFLLLLFTCLSVKADGIQKYKSLSYSVISQEPPHLRVYYNPDLRKLIFKSPLEIGVLELESNTMYSEHYSGVRMTDYIDKGNLDGYESIVYSNINPAFTIGKEDYERTYSGRFRIKGIDNVFPLLGNDIRAIFLSGSVWYILETYETESRDNLNLVIYNEVTGSITEQKLGKFYDASYKSNRKVVDYSVYNDKVYFVVETGDIPPYINELVALDLKDGVVETQYSTTDDLIGCFNDGVTLYIAKLSEWAMDLQGYTKETLSPQIISLDSSGKQTEVVNIDNWNQKIVPYGLIKSGDKYLVYQSDRIMMYDSMGQSIPNSEYPALSSGIDHTNYGTKDFYVSNDYILTTYYEDIYLHYLESEKLSTKKLFSDSDIWGGTIGLAGTDEFISLAIDSVIYYSNLKGDYTYDKMNEAVYQMDTIYRCSSIYKSVLVVTDELNNVYRIPLVNSNVDLHTEDPKYSLIDLSTGEILKIGRYQDLCPLTEEYIVIIDQNGEMFRCIE
jgi:hypothetical protein